MAEESKKEETRKIDGRLYKIAREGDKIKMVPLCSDCREPIPRYRDADGFGYISPESSELRFTQIYGQSAVEALERPVCVPCYLEAFKRVYPDAPLPKMSTDVI